MYLAITVLATITLYYELYVGGSVSTLILTNLHMSFTFFVLTLAFGALIGAFGSLFAGITDRTAAGELTGSWLSVDSSQLPAAPDPDEFRDHELIGLSVRTCAGEVVGVVTDVLHYGQDLLVVRRADRGDTLVPFVKAIVPEVDVAVGLLVIDPPPGLLDPTQAE